jgi:hypothetical protein
MPDLGAGYAMNPQVAQTKADQQAPAQPTGKVSAADAKYQDVAGNCGTCSHFLGDGQPCDVIVEPVAAAGWCTLYAEGQPNASPQQGDAPSSGNSGASPVTAQPGQSLNA